MSKVKTEGTAGVSSDIPLPEPSGELSTDVESSVFSDTVYTSRTLILPCGRAVPVAKGRVTAMDKTLLEYLAAHEDFQLLEE